MPPRNITACQEQGRDAEQRRQRRAVAKRLLVAAWLAAGALGQLAEAKRQEIAGGGGPRGSGHRGRQRLPQRRKVWPNRRSQPIMRRKERGGPHRTELFWPRIKTTSCIILSP